MPGVLICAGEGVARQLEGSPVWRDGLARQVVGTAEQAVSQTAASRPSLLVVDRDVPRAEYLIQKIRSTAETQKLSIVVVAGGDMQSEELGLLTAGANSILRLPPNAEWEATIARLLKVPTRKQTRVPVMLRFEADLGTGKVNGHVLNVSQTGMLVECAAPLGVGSEIRFDFHLPGFEVSTGDIRGVGRVVRMAGANRFGVEFASFDEYGGEMLRRFLLVP